MICLGMHSNVMLCFIMQAFQDPPLCSSTIEAITVLVFLQLQLFRHVYKINVRRPSFPMNIYEQVFLSFLVRIDVFFASISIYTKRYSKHCQ
jgi:hypothetical protein